MRMITPGQLGMLRHLAKAGQELFRDDEDYEGYLALLRSLAAEGWIELQVWPPPNRQAPRHRRRRFAIAHITPAGRLAISSIDRADFSRGDVEHPDSMGQTS